MVDMHVGFLDVYKRLKKDGCIQIFDTGWEDDLTLEKYKDYLEIADYYINTYYDILDGTYEVLKK